jgi:hypothetical protein
MLQETLEESPIFVSFGLVGKGNTFNSFKRVRKGMKSKMISKWEI